ncbi:Protein MAIN-LIKE 1 [Glycine max]|nr:Protein MAIN-LIKE 1 [Glycine max]
MARTRGLGRAIGRVIGRDRQDDHDDVPERRRPTASSRRQRDVPDMTEDVPDMAEDAPEMTADVQCHDGVEGSHADGFPGGPRDPSVLTSFADHVAHAVWSEHERPDLKLVSHGRKVTLIGRPARRWIVVARAYLLHLVGCTLFANKSATYVHVVHLDDFRDLGQSGGYAWGVAALVHMYDQLDEASRTTTRQIAGAGSMSTLVVCTSA